MWVYVIGIVSFALDKIRKMKFYLWQLPWEYTEYTNKLRIYLGNYFIIKILLKIIKKTLIFDKFFFFMCKDT